MTKEMTAQEIAARTLASIEELRRACEGKPRRKQAGEQSMEDMLQDLFRKGRK